MAISRYIKALSSFTIYVFTNVHLTLIALMEIILKSSFPINTHFAYFQASPIAKYLTLIMGVAALVNLKFQKFWLLTTSTLFLCFWFAYIGLGLALTYTQRNHTPLLFASGLILESLTVIYLTYRVHKDRAIPF